MCFIARDGASRSGVFIAVNYIIEKLKLEQEIDIFNAVRHIQKNRPQFVSSKVSTDIWIIKY